MVLEEHVFDETFDAIIGLAYPAMGEGISTPLFDTMMAQKVLKQNVFAFYMSMNDEEPSELIFGWIDSSKFYGELKWYPVVNKLFWSLKLDDVKYNNVSLGLCEHRDCMITPDSGTSTITFPTWAWT